MRRLEANTTTIAALLRDNVDRVLELSSEAPGQAAQDELIAKLIALVTDRYGSDDPVPFWEGLTTLRERFPMPRVLGGLEALEGAAGALLGEKKR
jgi:hypothetical protein